MEGEDEDSDNGREDEENCDDAQAEIDRKVAQMLQNQQQYIQMCSSSAQILHLLSRLVPVSGVGASGQALKLESVTDDSETSTPRSGSGSSARSPATSDDNSGCVLWAEPIMTCQLVPSWKPYCNDVRRLPPGVKPEDLKNQNPSRSGLSCVNGQSSGTAGNRYRYSVNWTENIPQHSRTNTASRNAIIQNSCKEECSNPPALNDSETENAGATNIVVTQAAFSEAISRISSAADTIKRARNILAAVNTGHQSNNNNNPDTSLGEGSSKESETAKSDQGKCDKDITGSCRDETANDMNIAADDASVGDEVQNISSNESHLQNENSTHKIFPAPILVKVATDRADTVQVWSEKTEDVNNKVNELSTSSDDADTSIRISDSGIFGLCDRTLSNDEPSKQCSKSRKQSMSSRHFNTDRATWDTRAKATDFHPSRIARQSRVNRNLYRYPSNNIMHQSNNRTHQSVSIGSSYDNNNLPPLENLPASLATKSPVSEKLNLDFGALGIPQVSRHFYRRYRITLAHFKNALEIAMNRLKQPDTVTVSDKSFNTDFSPNSRSTVSAFTLTEVESLNIPPDDAERDSPSSETVNAILSDIICEATNVAETNTSADNTGSMVDLATEVVNIIHIQHQSPNQSPVETELRAGSHCGLSRNEVKTVNHTHRVTSSKSQQTDALPCKMSHSFKEDSIGSREESQPCTPSSVSQQSYSHASVRTVCQDNVDTEGALRESASSSTVGALFYETLREDTGMNKTIEVTEIRRDEKLNESTRIASGYTNSEIRDTMNDTERTQANHSNTIESKYACAASEIKPNLKLDVRRAKSSVECDPVQKHNGSKRPRRPPSVLDRTKLEGYSPVDKVIVAKGGDGFPPTFPEAGDTIENLTKAGDIVRRSSSSCNQDMVRNEVRELSKAQTPFNEDNIPHYKQLTVFKVTKTTGKKNSAAGNEKSAWEDAGKEHTNTKTEQNKMNNLPLDKDNISARKASDCNIVRNGTSMQMQEHKEKVVTTSKATDTADHVVEISLIQEEIRQSNIADVKDKSQDSTVSLLEHNDSINSSLVRTPASTRSKGYLLVNNKEKSVHIKSLPPLNRTCGISCSRSLGMRFRRRSKCRSIVQHKNDTKNTDATKSIDTGKCSSTVLISTSNQAKFVDVVPGLLPEDNFSVCTFLPETSMKSTFVLHDLRATPPTSLEYNPKVNLNGILADEVTQITDHHAETLASLAAAGKDSSISSRSSSIDITGETRDCGVVPTPVSSSVVIAQATAPLITEGNAQQTSSGIKVRLRRFFAQCLRPFANRN